MKVRASDTSVLPAVARADDGHSHPRWANVALLVGGVVLIVVLWGLVLLFFQARAEEAQRNAYVDAELDRRTALREAADRKIQAQIDRQTAALQRQAAVERQATCEYVAADLPRTVRRQRLLTRLNCPEA